MLIKTGDMQPITIINPKDVDAMDAEKALKTAKKEAVKNSDANKTDKEVE